MGIFDDVVVNARTAANAVGKKAEQIVDLSKYKYAAAGLNNEISKKKEDLGDFIFEGSKSGNLDHDVIAQKIKELSELEDSYLAIKEQIAATKNKKACKECSAENDREATFCNNCGVRMESSEADTVTEDSDILEDVTVAVADTVDNIKEAVGDTVDKVVDFGNKAADKSAEMLHNVEDKVEDFAEDILDNAEDLADKAKEKFEEMNE